MAHITFPDNVAEALGITSVNHAARKMQSVMARATPEVAEFTKALPNIKPVSIMDIGSGLAAKTLLLTLLYPSIKLVHLIDGDGTAPHRGGYQEHTTAWARVHLGQDFLIHVLKTWEREALVTASLPNPASLTPALWSLIVSFRAWGHHFSVGTYSKWAFDHLEPGGHVVLDVRNDTGGHKAMLDAGFKFVTRIHDSSKKCERLAYTK